MAFNKRHCLQLAVVHLHGSQPEPSSNGHPDAWYTQKGERGRAYVKEVYTYLNFEEPSMMWYHDHTMGVTQISVSLGERAHIFLCWNALWDVMSMSVQG